MAHAYTPGLRVTPRTTVARKRILPIPGDILVKSGDGVKSDTVVARAMLPGPVHTVNIINILGIDPQDIRNFTVKKEGDKVKKGDVVAETRPLIKWFKNTVPSPVEGTIDSISEVTGQMLIREHPKPLDLLAYIDGNVTETYPGVGVKVETEAAFVQGIFGVGLETWGNILIAANSPDEIVKPGAITSTMSGKIIVLGAFVDLEIFNRAKQMGVRAIIAGGINDKDLKSLLGYDLGVAITGREKIPTTIVLTEGFGRIAIAKKTFDLLVAHNGRKASVSGATQIRAGVIRPEIIIPATSSTSDQKGKADWERGGMKVGDQIRIIRQPYFGRIATVTALPNDPVQIETESKVRILEARFSDGTTATIPRANVELIED
jgi:hypothetical protein